MTTETTEETSMADDIRAAMSDLGDDTTKEVVKEEVKEERVRDESGKFTSKEPAKEEVKEQTPPKEPISEKVPDAEKDPTQEQKEPLLTQDKAPIGWGVKSRERWAEIPKDLRDEIIRREDASAQGVRQLHEQFAPAKAFVNDLMPFIQEAVAGNQNPGEYIGRVMQSERRLRVGTDQERFGALVEIAESYGIPLRQIINEAVGRDVVQVPQKQQLPAEVQRELEENRRFRQQIEQQTAQQSQKEHPEITAFRTAAGHEYFEDVRTIMADIMEQPQNKNMTLQQAYDEALWHHPEIRDIIMQKQTGKDKLSDKQKGALGVKKSGSNDAETKSHDFSDEDSTEETVRKAIAQQMGRV